MSSDRNHFDAIVIGSGIGGLACATALARYGKAVLVLERQHVAGGLTQSFERNGFRWDVGLHYLGEMGTDGEARAIIDWLSGNAITFASLSNTYDIVNFPDNFTVPFTRPKAALAGELKIRFSDSAAAIDAFFDALDAAVHAGKALFTSRALSGFLGEIYNLWHKREVLKWWGRTTADVLDSLISDPQLRAVLLAQQGDHGGTEPANTSFGIHAVVMNHYLNGAWYPVGGARVFADTLVPVIEQAGGKVQLNTRVEALRIENEAATGVQLHDETVLHAPAIFSDIGARNTVGLLPAGLQQSAWAQEILSFHPSVCHVTLYLGLEGNIGAHGASASNHWFHETWGVDDSVWQLTDQHAPAPVLFVSFPSLKDPARVPDDHRRHTAEIVVLVGWEPFARWSLSALQDRPDEYTAFKSAIARRMLAQFARHFPELASMVVFQEVSTPLTMAAYSGAYRGASYGLEVTPRRFLSGSLNARTPIPHLFLTGQDVTSPGITGAMMGGVLSAASITHRIYSHLR